MAVLPIIYFRPLADGFHESLVKRAASEKLPRDLCDVLPRLHNLD